MGDTKCEEERKGLVVEVQNQAPQSYSWPHCRFPAVRRQWHNLSVPPFLPLWSLPMLSSPQLGKTCSGQANAQLPQVWSPSFISARPLETECKTLCKPPCQARLEAGSGAHHSSVMQRMWIPPSWWQKLWCQEDKDGQYFTAGSARKQQWKAAVLKRSLRHKSDQVNQFIGCY